MRSLGLSFAVWMAVTHQAMAFTYWIDKSCKGDRDMEPVIKEVKGFGESAHKRLNSATDTDYHHVYELAMKRKRDTGDAIFKDISSKTSLPDIGSLASITNDQKLSCKMSQK
jgi:hypothetical protein